jgi:homoserine kinase type II
VAILTKLSEGDVVRIAHEFGVVAARWTPIAAGSVNTNGRVETMDHKSYFLRVYEEQTEATARHEAALLLALADAGVPTPVPLRRSDGAGFIVPFGEKPVAMFPFIPGRSSCQKTVTVERAWLVGGALARVHDAGDAILAAPAGAHLGEGRFGRGALLGRLAGLHGLRLSADVQEAQTHLLAALERLEREPTEAGPRGLIHGDLFRDNVLFGDDERITLLDFESASRGPIAFDLAVTLLAWCFGDDLDLGLAAAMVGGYLAVRPLHPLARAALFDECLFACFRFATTRITDFELRPAGSGAYKDFRRWLDRERALRALGSTQLERALFGHAVDA